MRGKAQFLNVHLQNYGITPAYAGKRGIYQSGVRSRQDHPRLCGEKLTYAVCPLLALGSPPPMRGKGTAETGI